MQPEHQPRAGGRLRRGDDPRRARPARPPPLHAPDQLPREPRGQVPPPGRRGAADRDRGAGGAGGDDAARSADPRRAAPAHRAAAPVPRRAGAAGRHRPPDGARAGRALRAAGPVSARTATGNCSAKRPRRRPRPPQRPRPRPAAAPRATTGSTGSSASWPSCAPSSPRCARSWARDPLAHRRHRPAAHALDRVRARGRHSRRAAARQPLDRPLLRAPDAGCARPLPPDRPRHARVRRQRAQADGRHPRPARLGRRHLRAAPRPSASAPGRTWPAGRPAAPPSRTTRSTGRWPR